MTRYFFDFLVFIPKNNQNGQVTALPGTEKKKAKKAYRHRERQTSFYGIQKLGTPYMNSVAWGILAERTEKKKKHVPITNNDR